MRWLATLLVVLLANTAIADSASRARAEQLFKDGRKYLENAEYSLACAAFEQSQAVEPAIGTQLNIALCYEKWGKFAPAYQAYRDAESAATKAKDKRATVAKQHADKLAAKLARVKVALPANADPYAIYLLDGKEIEAAKLAREHLLDAARHEIEIRVPGSPPITKAFTIKAGESKTIELELPSSEKKQDKKKPDEVVEQPVEEAKPPTAAASTRSSTRLYGGIAMIVAGVAGLGIAGYVALDARSDYNAAVERCPMAMCTSIDDYNATVDARDRARNMTWVFGGGLVVAAVGTYFVVSSKREAPKDSISVKPLVGNGLGLAIGGSL